jgi:hypothetical protein
MRLLPLGGAALAGATLAACGSTVHTSSVTGTATVSKIQPVSASVGFNATKTVFVLPFHLGDLPAPELAIAKANPAYAAGLANPADWIEVMPAPNDQPSRYGRFYVGSLATELLSSLIEVKTIVPFVWHSFLNASKSYPGVTVTHTTKVAINAHALGNFPATDPNMIRQLEGHGYTIVTPSTLEVRAAPVGSLVIDGVTFGAFCVPSPEAVLKNGHVVTPVGWTPITAGPSTVFAFTAPTSPGAKTPSLPITLYDQGVSSCSNFS